MNDMKEFTDEIMKILDKYKKIVGTTNYGSMLMTDINGYNCLLFEGDGEKAQKVYQYSKEVYENG